MQKALLIGEDLRVQVLQEYLEKIQVEVTISDGDEDEDYEEYDLLFDLSFDDVSENFPIYAGLRRTSVFLSTVKQTLSESTFIYPAKVRSKLYGINAIPHYLGSDYWEVSVFRGNETEDLTQTMKALKKDYLIVDDSVGMYRPRVEFTAINEKIKSIERGWIPNYMSQNRIVQELREIDKIGVTPIFETLMAIYEDTRDQTYLPTTLLKKKYLRNHDFVK